MPRTWPEVEARLAAAERLRPMLERVASDGRTWMTAYRCRACGRAWAGELPYSEAHGGGPECLYVIEAADPAAWLRTADPVTAGLRRAEEDRRFFDALPPEAGPEPCREPGCPRRRMSPGVFCRCHHFEMVTRRPCPFWHRAAAG